jgi:hypothetical protein
VTVQIEQIDKAKAAGLHSVDDAADVADQIGATFYQLCALLEKESGGRNIYGNDAGGVLRGFKDPVNEDNWRAFRHEVLVNGRISNGVGPCQITYRGFFTDMEAQDLRPWVPHDNILYGGRIYWNDFLTSRAEGYSVKSSIIRAGSKYNSGEFGFLDYGRRLFELAQKWQTIVGTADRA